MFQSHVIFSLLLCDNVLNRGQYKSFIVNVNINAVFNLRFIVINRYNVFFSIRIQIVGHLEELAASNPDLETEVIGQSWEGTYSV